MSVQWKGLISGNFMIVESHGEKCISALEAHSKRKYQIQEREEGFRSPLFEWIEQTRCLLVQGKT